MNAARFGLPVLLVVVAACDRTPNPAAPAVPTLATATDTTPGRIAFVSTRDGNQEVYVVNTDGTGLTRLTNDPGADYFPAWSPDGSRIATLDFPSRTVDTLNASDVRDLRAVHPGGIQFVPGWQPRGTGTEDDG